MSAKKDVLDDLDEDALKDLFYPSGETAQFEAVGMAFRGAGYRVVKEELVRTHPIWIFRLVRRSAPQISDEHEFIQHLSGLMQSVGVRICQRNVMIHRNGDRILISFLWQVPTKAARRKAAWESGRYAKFVYKKSQKLPA